MDGRYQEAVPGKFDRALTLLTAVLPVKERYAVCDAGLKSRTNEFGPPMSRDGAVIDRWPIPGARKFKWAIMAVFPPGSPRAGPDSPED